MALARYAIRKENDETWTVYLILTGHPAIVDGVPQVGLDVDDAGYVANMLNRIAEGKDAAER
jgi:hypothetical protein